MPTFSRHLEESLHRALALANERQHEYATLEHLLLALIDDTDAAAGDAGLRRRSGQAARQSLVDYLDTELETSSRDDARGRQAHRRASSG